MIKSFCKTMKIYHLGVKRPCRVVLSLYITIEINNNIVHFLDRIGLGSSDEVLGGKDEIASTITLVV